MYRIDLIRQPSDTVQTLGNFTLTVYKVTDYLNDVPIIQEPVEVLKGVTLELPWLNNQHQISCILPGVYDLELWNSEKFGKCLHVRMVPDRDAILIHKGNFNKDTHGCILVGSRFSDIDKDGYLDVIESGVTLNKLMSLIEGDGVLIISS
jgi:hypothetical protein